MAAPRDHGPGSPLDVVASRSSAARERFDAWTELLERERRIAVVPLMAEGLIALGARLHAPRAEATEVRDL
jgi:hypothetical protein